MSCLLFYLVPARGCMAAEQVLRLRQNRHSLIRIPYNDDSTGDPGLACIPVKIDIETTGNWSFTIGSREDSDLFLPCGADQRIKCSLWLCGRPDDDINDSESVSLMVSDSSSSPRYTIAAKVLDPINEDERMGQTMDDFSRSTRFLKHPTEIRIATYHFEIRRPFTRTPREAAMLETRKREVMTVSPRNMVEDWRETGIFLGGGTFGKVFLMRGMRTGIQAARKHVVAENPTVEETNQIKAELAIIKSLNHENVMCCIDSFEHSSTNTFTMDIIMPYFRIDLKNFLIIHPDADIFEVIFRQVMNGVEHLHKKDIIHRDLKPGNIMLLHPRAPYKVAITDFGLSKALGGNINTGNCGTPFYVAPEILSGRRSRAQYSLPADIFSCGLIAIELLETRNFQIVQAPLRARYRDLRNDGELVLAFYQRLRDCCQNSPLRDISTMILAMMDNNPQNRPKASRVVRAMNRVAHVNAGADIVQTVQEEIVSPSMGQIEPEVAQMEQHEAPPVVEARNTPQAGRQPLQAPIEPEVEELHESLLPRPEPRINPQVNCQPPQTLVGPQLTQEEARPVIPVQRLEMHESQQIPDLPARIEPATGLQAGPRPSQTPAEMCADRGVGPLGLNARQSQGLAQAKRSHRRFKPTTMRTRDPTKPRLYTMQRMAVGIELPNTPLQRPIAERWTDFQKELPKFEGSKGLVLNNHLGSGGRRVLATTNEPAAASVKLSGNGSRRLSKDEVKVSRNHEYLYKRQYRRWKAFVASQFVRGPPCTLIKPRMPGGLCVCPDKNCMLMSFTDRCTANQ